MPAEFGRLIANAYALVVSHADRHGAFRSGSDGIRHQRETLIRGNGVTRCEREVYYVGEVASKRKAKYSWNLRISLE